MLRKIILAALGLSAALLVGLPVAQAVIDGNNTASQRQRLYMGEVVPGADTVTQASPGAGVTLNAGAGTINLSTLTLTGAAVTTINLSNSRVLSGDRLLVTLDAGTNTTGEPLLTTASINADGSILLKIRNIATNGAALNGALRIYFLLLRQGNVN